MRVLVVEDESYLADAIALGLRRETMAVDVVGNGAEALAQVEFTDYDVVVLDRDLPGVHGDEVCARLAREHPDVKVPIHISIFLFIIFSLFSTYNLYDGIYCSCNIVKLC